MRQDKLRAEVHFGVNELPEGLFAMNNAVYDLFQPVDYTEPARYKITIRVEEN